MMCVCVGFPNVPSQGKVKLAVSCFKILRLFQERVGTESLDTQKSQVEQSQHWNQNNQMSLGEIYERSNQNKHGMLNRFFPSSLALVIVDDGNHLAPGVGAPFEKKQTKP